MGYSTWDFQNTSETTLNGDDYTGLNRLNKEILFWSGHGNEGFVSVVNYNLTKTYLFSSELPYMGNVKLAVWATCYSSSGNSSMAEVSVDNGARASIGWPDTTTVGSSRTFTNHLFIRLNDGYSISDSASYASSKIIWPWDNVKDYELFGTTTGTIYSSVNNKQNTTSYVPLYSYPDPPWYYNTIPNTLLDTSLIENVNSVDLDVYKDNLHYEDNEEDVFRHYTIINGILTTNFTDRTESGRVVNNHITKFDLEDIDFELFTSFDHSNYIDYNSYFGYNVSENSSHNAIINLKGVTIPVRIVYLDFVDS